jgi:ABC-type transport system substrate-binding protein/class 3 adenylate cyclase
VAGAAQHHGTTSDPRDPEAAETTGSSSPPSHSTASETELRTFLIADIRGYTTYTREHGDEAGAALAAHFAELVAEVVTGHDGFLVELRGDEALVVFVSARKALRAAIDLQARFAEAQLARGVGIGLDAGEAIPVGDGYRGTALNLAARLCSEAGPNETLASEAVIHLAAKIEGIAYVDARGLKLKGYADPVRVVAVLPSERAGGHRLASGNGAPESHKGRYAIAVAGAAAAGVAVVALLAAALGGGFGETARPSDGGASPSPAPSASPDPLGGAQLPLLAFYDAKSGDLEATAPLTKPSNIAFFSDGSFWSRGENPQAFNRIDPVSREVVQSIPVPVVEANGFSMDDDSIWMTDLAGPHLIRLDKRTGVVSDVPFGVDASDTEPAYDVAAGGGSVWLARSDVPEIVRLDAETGTVQARIPVTAYGVAYGADGLWYWEAGRIGRIDPVTNEPAFDPVTLTSTGWLGNIAFGGGDAWTAQSSSGGVWRVDRSGGVTNFTLPPGVGELAATEDTMWVTNADTGELSGIDLVTGEQDRVIDTGHATLAVATSADEIMVAVGPTADEVIAGLEGSVLTLATSGTPWQEPAPDPPVNDSWQVRQALYLTCVSLVSYPDRAAPDGFALEPEAAAAMPTISPDGRSYTFTVRAGFRFSPPSDEPVTAETFRATIERALSPVFDDDAPGPTAFGDVAGAKEYRSGTADHVSGLAAEGDRLTITLEAPAPDFLARLASPAACPVPARTPVLRSGLDPDPPISGAGPYYLAQIIRRRLVVLEKNPNYHGPRPQPFDAIAIRTNVASTTAVAMVEHGEIDAAMLADSDPVSDPSSALATEWGPGSANAAAGDQRWFGGPALSVYAFALNPTRPALRDADVRRAISLALDRAVLGGIWNAAPSDDLLPPSVPGSVDPTPPVPSPDLEAARALLDGRTLEVTMLGFPTEWGGVTRDTENALTGQLKAIGITLAVSHDGEWPTAAFAPGSSFDLVPIGLGTAYPDPVWLMIDLGGVPWLGEANLADLRRLQGLDGQARIDGAAAFARRVVDEEALVLPTGYPVYPFFISDRLGCAFVQPALGGVDLLSLCAKDGAATPSTPPGPSP